jgi:hypothetical protein
VAALRDTSAHVTSVHMLSYISALNRTSVAKRVVLGQLHGHEHNLVGREDDVELVRALVQQPQHGLAPAAGDCGDDLQGRIGDRTGVDEAVGCPGGAFVGRLQHGHVASDQAVRVGACGYEK